MSPLLVEFLLEWSDRYKEARTFLYSSDDIEPDFLQELSLFLAEAQTGNVFAMHDLGRMYADGLGVEIDKELSFSWYRKALDVFFVIEAEKENKYVEYRIGKMYAAGLGTEQDFEEAAGWFETAAAQNHKYAQYSLAGLYYRGQGVENRTLKPPSIYTADLPDSVCPMPTMSWQKCTETASAHRRMQKQPGCILRKAFLGFQRLEEQSHDDKLQYRLGQMLYTGTGTEKDVSAAIGYF